MSKKLEQKEMELLLFPCPSWQQYHTVTTLVAFIIPTATYLKEATSGKKDLFWLRSIGKAKWNDTICVSGSRRQWLHMVAGREERKALPEPTQAQLRKAHAHFGESGPCPLRRVGPTLQRLFRTAA